MSSVVIRTTTDLPIETVACNLPLPSIGLTDAYSSREGFCRVDRGWVIADTRPATDEECASMLATLRDLSHGATLDFEVVTHLS